MSLNKKNQNESKWKVGLQISIEIILGKSNQFEILPISYGQGNVSQSVESNIQKVESIIGENNILGTTSREQNGILSKEHSLTLE